MPPAPTPKNYNPHWPCTIGPEWFPYVDEAAWLDSDQNVLGVALTASTTDEINRVWPMVVSWMGTQTSSLEIMDLTANPAPQGLAPQPLTWATFYPGINKSTGSAATHPPLMPGAWGAFNGWSVTSGGADAWKALNSVTLTPGPTFLGIPVANNQMVFNYYGEGFDFSIGFNGTNGSHTGRWITRIRSRFVMAQYFGPGGPFGGINLTPYIWMNGIGFYGPPITLNQATAPADLHYDWYVNPQTGVPWIPSDVDKFDTAFPTSGYAMGYKMNRTGQINNIGTILQAQLQVESAATDTRLALAGRTGPAANTGTSAWGAQGWMVYNLLNNSGGTTAITLIPGHKYLFVFRKQTSGASTHWGLAASSDPASFRGTGESLVKYGPPYWTQYVGPVGFGQPQGEHAVLGTGIRVDNDTRLITDLGIETGRTVGIALQKVGAGGMSLDSQPYATTSPLDGADPWGALNEFFNNSPINSGRWMKQQITTSGAGDYSWIFINCAQVAGTTDGDLVIEVRKQSDDSQVGETITITSADLRSPRHQWHKIGKGMNTPAALAAATQYYLSITSTAAPATGWLVQCLNSGYEPNPTGPPAGTNAAAGWGAGVDLLTFGDPAMDRFGWTAPDAPGSVVAQITLSERPDPPINFAADSFGATCNIDHIVLTWEVTGSEWTCSEFYAYEIQRNDDPTLVADWHSIALITDVAVQEFFDYESKTNTVATYRMRHVNAQGIPSYWTEVATATAEMSLPGLIFTSNEQPDLTLFYYDLLQERKFEFPTQAQQFAPQGRNYQIVFKELEYRGVTMKATLRVRSGNMPCGPGCDDATGLGVDVYKPVLDISQAGLSYVCVKNESGNRWFAYIQIPDGTWVQDGQERIGGFGSYKASLTMIEVTDTPSTPDAQA